MSVSALARPMEATKHEDLLKEILELKKFGDALKQEVIIKPLTDVIDRVLDLPKNLDGLDEKEIHEVKRKVEECKKTLDDFGYTRIRLMLTPVEQSDVFKAVSNVDLFTRDLRKLTGDPITLRKLGEEAANIDSENSNSPRETGILSEDIVKAMTRFRSSIGTPPITPKGIEAIEQMIFGGGLGNIYQFRELLGGGDSVKYLFDGFLANVDRMVQQSTHYTTAAERRDFEKKAVDFNNFEGLRGLKKSVVSGTSKTAIRLIEDELFRRHGVGKSPVEVMEDTDCLNDALIARMKKEKETIFVVKVSKVPHHLLTSDKLDEKWHGILGRLILVQDSPNSRRSNTCVVYSLFNDVTETLNVLHVKDSGTPANTQMNLRLIIENFSADGLTIIEDKVKEKIEDYEKRGVTQEGPQEVRKQGWKLTAQSDYLNLKKFLRFVEFIKKIQSADDKQLAEIQADLIGKNEEAAMDYFYKKLKGKGYDIVSVPQGGGRKELGHVGKFLSGKFNQKLTGFDNKACRARLETLKVKRGIEHSQAETAMLNTVNLQNRDDLAALREPNTGPGNVESMLREQLRRLKARGVSGAGAALDKMTAAADSVAASNVSGRVRAKLSQKLDDWGIGSGSKLFEKGRSAKVEKHVVDALGFLRRHVGKGIDGLDNVVKNVEAEVDFQDLSLAERLLNDIEKGSLKPSLALSEVGWTFGDVLHEEDFPASNYLRITMGADGELDTNSLEAQIETAERKLHNFPELFSLFCSSTVLLINDPHNPTSRVMKPETKFALLRIASKYGLTIISDDAYLKQVDKGTKQRQGDSTLAEYYELHRKSSDKPVTIYSTLPTTKWAMGAGERTGTVVSNEKELVNGQSFTEYVRANTDSANTMSLYFDAEKYDIGIKVKDICDKFYVAILMPKVLTLGLVKAENIIDGILKKDFSDITAPGFSSPLYFALIEARNNLERLEKRGATDKDIRKYISSFVSKLKDLRLDKQTQRDSAARSKAVAAAIDRVTVDHPFLKESSIKPDGPFYVCVKLDDGPVDPSLSPFLLSMARWRGIDVVPDRIKGYTRLAFGGELDGTTGDYGNLGLDIEVKLRILIHYWQKFKEVRSALNDEKDPNPEVNALEKLFPGTEQDILQAAQEKWDTAKALSQYKGKKRKKLVYDLPANVAGNITSIEPDSATSIITLTAIKCKNLREFVNSDQFQDIFNFYLLKIKSKVPALRHLEDTDAIAFFGARQFADKEASRTIKDDERATYEQIAIEIAKIWFSDNTVKILASVEEESSAFALLGAEKMLGNHIRSFLKVFTTPEAQAALLQSFRVVSKVAEGYLPVEVTYPASIQAGYKAVRGVKADSSLPDWSIGMIGKGEFVANSTATDSSPTMSTPGTARVPGVDRAILRRDGDGKEAPDRKFFSDRLKKFSEVMDPKDYVMKMVQIGGTKVLLVMNRSYSHYMVEELRLFPQTDLTPADMANCKPDAVSFMGLPTKVMGEDYRIGYFMDQNKDGETLPVSWVDAESITDYMGYLKKPVLTVANEKVREKEMMPVHGSAFSIIFKDGKRKTVVMGGDSGTGKSETIIAMIEQIITNKGLASQVEGIEFLSGDMLSMFEGNDKQMYMLGTEQGDFMRMTDIPADWKKRVRDRIDNGSKTNLNDETNPRVTIGDLCNPTEFQKPVRVNCFFNINNFKKPAGSSIRESKSAKNLMLDEYVMGYRGEKGTSGDQPNLYASVSEGNDNSEDPAIKQFGKDLDILLGWDILTGPKGNAEKAFLKFNDKHGGVFKAKAMIDQLFIGKKIGNKEIIATRYDCGKNRYFAILAPVEEPAVRENKLKEFFDTAKAKVEANMKKHNCDLAKALLITAVELKRKDICEEKVIDRDGIFGKIYTKIASTYAGDPFVDARKMGPTLERFAEIMERAGVITGTLYTQLKVDKMTEAGPAKASQDLLKFLIEDERIKDRFQEHISVVQENLHKKYGAEVLNSSTIPVDVTAHNLFLLERHESDNVYPIDSKGERIDLETPHYKYNPDSVKLPFSSSLITPEISDVIRKVCNNPEYNKFSLGSFEFVMSEYKNIQAWDSKEELTYQVLIKNGLARLNYSDTNISQIPPKEVKKAEKIAEAIMAERKSGVAAPEPINYQI